MSRIGLKVIEVPEKVTVTKMVTTSLVRDQKVNLLDTLIHALPLNKKMEKFILVVQVKLTKLFMVLKEQILLP